MLSFSQRLDEQSGGRLSFGGREARGTNLREALRGSLPLRGLPAVSAGLSSEGSTGSPRGSFPGPRDLPRVVTLSLCWVGTASGPFLENDFHPT